MEIKRIVVGPLATNCYILTIDNDALIIDPGAEFSKISSFLKDKKVLAILITHNHFDHIGCLSSFKDIPIYDGNNLKEKEYQIGRFVFDVITTKGHSEDSISFYFKNNNILFSGDFLFYENIGRTDLPTGNDYDMQKSIKKIIKYPPNMIIYPGHGCETSLQHEIQNNSYLKK